MSARAIPFPPLAILLLAAGTTVQAQDHSQHQMPVSSPVQDHSRHQADQKPKPAEEKATPKPEATIDHAAMGHAPSPASGQIPPPLPSLTDADRAAAFPAVTRHEMHDNKIISFVQFNRLEAWDADAGTGFAWEGRAWIGKDLDKLWLRSEGEHDGNHTETADLEVLYGRAVAPWWDLVAGVRHDFRPEPSQGWIAIGVVGLAPQKFEVEATAYLGESGQTSARIEAEYELLLTNRLILQPLVEVNLYGRNDAERGIGSGLGTVEAGLRLRYELTRKFAPYIGVVHERAFGNTAELRRADGEDAEDTRLVAGVRVWF